MSLCHALKLLWFRGITWIQSTEECCIVETWGTRRLQTIFLLTHIACHCRKVLQELTRTKILTPYTGSFHSPFIYNLAWNGYNSDSNSFTASLHPTLIYRCVSYATCYCTIDSDLFFCGGFASYLPVKVRKLDFADGKKGFVKSNSIFKMSSSQWFFGLLGNWSLQDEHLAEHLGCTHWS